MINLIKRIFKIKRYFIISFSVNNVHGDLEWMCYSGNYPNRKLMVEYISKSRKDLKDPIISSIIEVNKRDFNDYKEII